VEPKNGIVKSAKGALYGPGIVRLFYPSKYPQNKPGIGGWDNEGYIAPSLPEKIWGEVKIFIGVFCKKEIRLLKQSFRLCKNTQ
jgi:hypothetical protein